MKNVCIVGYGSIGPLHAQFLERISGVRLYAVCDTDPRALERCRAEHDMLCYDRYEDVLADPMVDAVHICTPHHLHFAMIREALKWGKNVVAEKPVTRTLSEFEELLRLEGAEKICVIVQNRYNNSIRELKRRMEQGELGQIRAVKGTVTWHKDPEYYTHSPWKGKWATEGGSCLINQALHTLDLMLYLGGKTESLQARIHNYSLADVIETEDTVDACLQLSGGITGLFYATNAYGVNTPAEIEVVGSKATARYAYQKLFIDGQPVCDDAVSISGQAYWGAGHYTALKDYYEHGHFFSPRDIENSMRTLFAIYESAAHGSAVIRL